MDRKDLKREYKETEQLAGIYQVRNRINGKIFVKASSNIPAAFNSIKFQLKLGSGFFDASFNREWKEYGEENFEFTVLEELKPSDSEFFDEKAELAKLEEKWIGKLQPFGDSGYNRKKIER
jgi:hypothetical protein